MYVCYKGKTVKIMCKALFNFTWSVNSCFFFFTLNAVWSTSSPCEWTKWFCELLFSACSFLLGLGPISVISLNKITCIVHQDSWGEISYSPWKKSTCGTITLVWVPSNCLFDKRPFYNFFEDISVNDCNYDCNLSNADLLNYVNLVTFKSFWQSKWASESLCIIT